MTLTTVCFAFFLIMLWRRRASFHRVSRRIPLSNQTRRVLKSIGQLQLPYQVRDTFYMCASLVFFALVLAVTFSWAT